MTEAAAAEATTPEAWIERALVQQLDEVRWQRLVGAGQRQSGALGYAEPTSSGSSRSAGPRPGRTAKRG